MNRLRFLLLEDNSLDVEVTQVTLIVGGVDAELLWVSTREDFVRMLETAEFDLILADYQLPNFDGLTALRLVRDRLPEVPFIFVSGSLGEERAIEALKQGATDYVLKQRMGRLVPCVQRALREVEERRERQAAERDRHRVEVALHQSEARLRAVAANLPNGAAFIIGPDLRYQLAVGQALDQAGFTAADLVGKTLWEALPPEVADHYALYYRQALAGESYTLEHHSHNRYYVSHGTPLYNDHHEVEGALAVSYDITDRKRAEDALRESEARFRHMTDAAPMLVWMAGTDRQCYYFNQSWLAFTGRSLNQECGMGWAEGIHRDDVQRSLDTYNTCFDARQSFEMEYRLRRCDGEYRWILDVGVPRFTPEGEFLGYIGSCFDIHDRVLAETEREQLLRREQAARTEAENANRMKDEFLAVLSHELRSPLNPILGWAKLLKKGKMEPAKVSNALDTIERNAQLQAQLVDDLLDISRIMRGKLSLTVTSVNLSFVIRAAVETVRLAAESKNIEVTLDLQEAIAPISGDIARLQQVVWNLLNNAVKFTPEGGQVSVELRQVNQFAQIRVTDTGKGIRPEFLPHVFEYFQQEDGSTTRKFGGLGLGLAIARQIVEMHGGRVWAESEGEQKGATFGVQFPLMTQQQAIAPEPHQALTDSTAPLENLQVLLVDDDEDTRTFQEFLLEQGGAVVKAVASGLAALAALEHFVPDVMVSDIGMAEMDGYMLLEQIRRRPTQAGRELRAIALTAYAAEVDHQKAMQAGFQAYLTKPVDPDALVEVVREVCLCQQ